MDGENYWPDYELDYSFDELSDDLINFLRGECKIEIRENSALLNSAKSALSECKNRSGTKGRREVKALEAKIEKINSKAKKLLIQIKSLPPTVLNKLKLDFDEYISEVEMALLRELTAGDENSCENGHDDASYVYANFRRKSIFDVVEYIQEYQAPAFAGNIYGEFIYKFTYDFMFGLHCVPSDDPEIGCSAIIKLSSDQLIDACKKIN